MSLKEGYCVWPECDSFETTDSDGNFIETAVCNDCADLYGLNTD